VRDTTAPQGTIKSGLFFFFNTIKGYCQDIVIDSENLFPEFSLLKLKISIKAIDIYGNKFHNAEALIDRKQQPSLPPAVFSLEAAYFCFYLFCLLPPKFLITYLHIYFSFIYCRQFLLVFFER
jgi:hypothetical protein